MRSLGLGVPAMAISVARLPLASAMRRRSASGAGAVALPGSDAQSLDDAGHGAGGAHDGTSTDGGAEATADGFDFDEVDIAGAMLTPHAAAVGAGTEDFTLMIANDHRSGLEDDGREVGAGEGHDLRGERLVAAADEDDGVHGLRLHHLLGVHRHEIAEEHGSGVGEAFADGDGWEDHGQAAGEHDAALDALDEIGDVAVAGVVVAEGVGDADDRALESVVGVSHCLDEGLTEKEREAGVSVAGEALS